MWKKQKAGTRPLIGSMDIILFIDYVNIEFLAQTPTHETKVFLF